jgi:hypothetical protein
MLVTSWSEYRNFSMHPNRLDVIRTPSGMCGKTMSAATCLHGDLALDVFHFAVVIDSRFQPPLFFPLYMTLVDRSHLLLYPHVVARFLLCVTFLVRLLLSSLG